MLGCMGILGIDRCESCGLEVNGGLRKCWVDVGIEWDVWFCRRCMVARSVTVERDFCESTKCRNNEWIGSNVLV